MCLGYFKLVCQYYTQYRVSILNRKICFIYFYIDYQQHIYPQYVLFRVDEPDFVETSGAKIHRPFLHRCSDNTENRKTVMKSLHPKDRRYYREYVRDREAKQGYMKAKISIIVN